MKPIVSILSVLLACATAALGQELIKVEVVMEQTQFLPNEELTVGVRITNQSGQPLSFGKDNEWLTFNVEGAKGRPVPRIRPMEVKGAFTAEQTAWTMARFDLSPSYDLVDSGNYSVTASVTVKEWGKVYSSEAKRFDIVRGTTVWKQEFGVPREEGAGGPPEVRKYIVEQARQKGQLSLYVRLTDGSERVVYKVFPVGLVLNFGQPEFQLDRFNNLHLLHQDGRNTYNRCTINPDGEILIRQAYQIVTKPKLALGANGLVTVTGGVRTLAPTDIPKPPEDRQISQKTSP
jgi:hypothetical protein